MLKLKKCKCGYTLKDACPKCGAKSESVHPPKFSPEDKYGGYRRKAKANK